MPGAVPVEKTVASVPTVDVLNHEAHRGGGTTIVNGATATSADAASSSHQGVHSA